jgi:hypothetical protein
MNPPPMKLLTLQAYSLRRPALRPAMIRHRRERGLPFGPYMRVQFEDELTVRHQIQEVLYAERHEDAAHEIATYAHLLPDGRQWKATLQIEIADAAVRARLLPPLNEAVHHLYVDVAGEPRVHAFANEDLPDGHRSRPSGVHFLRFALPAPARAALGRGAGATLGCTHESYPFRRTLPPPLQERLCGDLGLPAAALAFTLD